MTTKPSDISSPNRSQSQTANYSFYEFFAGGGMARAGLGQRWNCLLANDFDPRKASVYRDNWGGEHLIEGDVWKITPQDLPGRADLAWASFPCQDLSLAGSQAGLRGARSGAFWGFMQAMEGLKKEDRHPGLIVLENVYGAVTSNGGKDFEALLDALAGIGYRSGALVVDAVHFVPQSRPRLFVIAVRRDLAVPPRVVMQGTYPLWTPSGLSAVLKTPSFQNRSDWVSWRLGHPPARNQVFADIIDEVPVGIEWHSASETAQLIGMMNDHNRAKVEAAQLCGRRTVGTIYKRTRPDEDGVRRQRAEVRFDDIAGCLRTPGGGSSRQSIIVVEGARVRSRLLSTREAARLMGLPEDYRLPQNYNDAYRLAGDGVVVPVVRHIASYLLEPVLAAQARSSVDAA